MDVYRDSSLQILIDGLRPRQRVLFKNMMHYDERGILDWWIDMQKTSVQIECNVLIQMVHDDIAELKFKDTVGELELGGRQLLKGIGIE